jgi:heat shock protein HslJ
MNKWTFSILTTITVLLAACTSPQTFLPSESQLKTSETTQAPSNQLSAVGDITNITWQWQALSETQPPSQSIVSEPQNYTLNFMPNGTFSAKADCNMVSGTYTLEENKMELIVGPTTLAECGPDSKYNQYLALLEQVKTYHLVHGLLFLAGNNGQMGFSDARTTTSAPLSATVISPDRPEASSIVDILWKWSDLVMSEGPTGTSLATPAVVLDPDRYTLSFLTNGSVRVLADCNTLAGTYVINASNLTISLTAMTLSICEPGSFSDLYIHLLGQVATYQISNDKLLLGLKDDSGQMGFTNGGPVVVIPFPQTGKPTVTAFYAGEVRNGPGIDFPSYGVFSAGVSAEVIGKSPDGAWYVIRIPTDIASNGQGWISSVQTRLYHITPAELPIIQPPASPPAIQPEPSANGSG